VEGSGRGLIWVIISANSWKDRKFTKASLSVTGLGSRLNPTPPEYEAKLCGVNGKMVKSLQDIFQKNMKQLYIFIQYVLNQVICYITE
jgi:hypothetical protein